MSQLNKYNQNNIAELLEAHAQLLVSNSSTLAIQSFYHGVQQLLDQIADIERHGLTTTVSTQSDTLTALKNMLLAAAMFKFIASKE